MQARRGLFTLSAIVLASSLLTGCGGGTDEDAPDAAAEDAADPTKDAADPTKDEAAPEKDSPDAPPVDDEVQVAWSTTGGYFEAGTVFDFECPPGGALDWRVWGGVDGQYTDDSSICVAAVHAGLITTEDGGTVEVERTPGLETYGEGSTANGVTSEPWLAPWSGSFAFPKA